MAKFKVNVDCGVTLPNGTHAPVYSEIDVDPKAFASEIKTGRLVPVVAESPEKVSARFLGDEELYSKK